MCLPSLCHQPLQCPQGVQVPSQCPPCAPPAPAMSLGVHVPPHPEVLTVLFPLPPDFGVGLAPFHTKLPPEMENSLYSQL